MRRHGGRRGSRPRPRLADEKHLAGWVNVPADCVRPLRRIKLARGPPAGLNEPTPAGVAGSEEILRQVAALHSDDLCLCLISGGGSALLPAPEAITLEDKLALTRHSAPPAPTSPQLNTVRKQLSRIKGGGLPRACRAGRLVASIISDVLGDPLDLIASGPTVPTIRPRRRRPGGAGTVSRPGCRHFFRRVVAISASRSDRPCRPPPPCQRDQPRDRQQRHGRGGRGREGGALGYSHAMVRASAAEGPAEDVGRHLAGMALRMRSRPGPDCLISGGEPVVRLVEPSRRGLGGRNQQLVLAALEALAGRRRRGHRLALRRHRRRRRPDRCRRRGFGRRVLAAVRRLGLDPADYLARNDAYHFFAPLDALIKTGPTHTNVCDSAGGAGRPED